MTDSVLLVLGGLVLLGVGGELLVRGAVGLASRMGISPMLAGLTCGSPREAEVPHAY